MNDRKEEEGACNEDTKGVKERGENEKKRGGENTKTVTLGQIEKLKGDELRNSAGSQRR